MGSLKYEISQRYKELMQTEASAGGKQATEKSWRTYMDATVHFGQWCKQQYHCRHFDDCREHIQDYTDWLVKQGKTASTIHTYIAGVCRVYEVPLDKVCKPKRITSKNTRSRGTKNVDNQSDAAKEISPRLYDFASAVGIRRTKYAHLRGSDLAYDESGYLTICWRIKGFKVVGTNDILL